MLRPMPNGTTRAVFRLGPSCCLYYNDARRFGWIRPAGPDPCRTDPFLARLGPDPLGGSFTPAVLRQALARHPRGPVKAVLLDQTAIAGIGNIYADEILHRARIHPSRPAGGLSRAETRRLRSAIRDILRAAVDSGGTSFAGYVDEARGRPGYLGQAHVFRRQGLPCDVCGTPIIRATVAGRATNYCPHCQQR
jgi:formamidopyrimidine-DNA glycosylase